MITVTEMPKEAGKYVVRRRPIRAIQFHTAFVVENATSQMVGSMGDYLVEEAPGKLVVLAPSKFNEMYEPWQY